MKRRALIFSLTILQGALLFPAVIRVPGDHLTIKSAVLASRNGDVVVVDDGIYFEKNIIIDKDIELRAAHLYGAFIYGTKAIGACIFIVRAKAEISGFVLLNSTQGIKQRNSPDVAWHAHDLWIVNMEDFGIQVDDEKSNIGSAYLANLIIEKCGTGIGSNDARDIHVTNSIIANCRAAFGGSDHISFKVERTAVWNCHLTINEDRKALPPTKVNNAVTLRDVVDIDRLALSADPLKLKMSLLSFLKSGNDLPSQAKANARKRDCLISKMVGDNFLLKAKLDSATQAFSEAISRGRECVFPYIVMRALNGRAMVNQRLGRNPLAIRDLKDAVREIDLLYAGIPFKLFQTEFFDDKIEVYESLLDELFAADRNEPNQGYAKEAFQYADRLKAGGLLEIAGSSRSGDPAAGSGGSDDRGRKLRENIGLLQNDLNQNDLTAARQTQVMERLEDAEDEYKAWLVGQRRRGRVEPSRPAPDASRIDPDGELRLNPDTILIEYFIGNKSAYLFCLTREKTEILRLPDRPVLDDLVVNYQSFLTLEGDREFAGTQGGRRLYDILLGPIEEKLARGIEKIIVVPDGILNLLPFEALVRPGPGAPSGTPPGKNPDARFLIETCEVTYAPSARNWTLLNRRGDTPQRDMDLFLYANPGENGRMIYLAQSRRDISKLAFIEQEVRAVTSYFPKTKTVVKRAAARDEEALKLQDLSKFRILHFATHGFFDNDHWWRSALLLRAGSGPSEDGLFQPFDILGLKLNSDLVVLSACQSGSGRIEKGEGPMGLSSAFLGAGTKAVLSSLWSIPDRSAAVFMDRFYARLADGKTLGEALKLAKIEMLRSGYGHPRYWASFILSGSGASRIREN
jgi:CHAT domain-containing protein